jgi:SAM-dependent methyltransferase
MVLSRSRLKALDAAKGLIFDKGGFAQMLGRRHKARLEDSMGFRGQFDEHRRFQLAFLKERGLQPKHKVLEIGCGPLTAGVPLIDYLDKGNYAGVDIRQSALDLAWAEVGNAGLSRKNPRLIWSCSFGSDELGSETFDFVFSFSVLYHLSDDILASYFATVRERMTPRGVLFANVNIFNPASTWLEFPFVKRSLGEYESISRSNGLSIENLGEIENLGFRLPGQERRNQMLLFERL